MSRVTKKTLEKLQAFFDSLEPEVQGKCALCNETLIHIVKLAEVQTGAGTATVTRELASRVNEGAAPGDVVSGEALRSRVENKEFGRLDKCRNPTNKPEPQAPPAPTTTTNQEEPAKEQPREQPKTKQKPKPVKDDRRVTPEFMRCFEEMKYAILNEREAGWSGMTRNTATQYAQALINIIGIGE